MSVKEIKSAVLRKRVEKEQAHICLEEFNVDTPEVKMFNKIGLPEGDGWVMLPPPPI